MISKELELRLSIINALIDRGFKVFSIHPESDEELPYIYVSDSMNSRGSTFSDQYLASSIISFYVYNNDIYDYGYIDKMLTVIQLIIEEDLKIPINRIDQRDIQSGDSEMTGILRIEILV